MSLARSPILRFRLIGAREYLEDLVDSRDEEAVASAVIQYGNLRLRRAALASAIRDRQLRPRIRGYPPKVFIGYRWQGDDHRQWVAKLAAHLRELGYRVFLDIEHLVELGPNAN